MRMKKNEIYTVDIDSYSSVGDGIGRIDGIATFVKGALAGETVEVKITKVAKNCAWARLLKVAKSSPERIKPDCQHAMACGGCSLQHMSYEEELNFKLLRVNDALQRIGKLNFKVEKIHASAQNFRYRNKATFPVGSDKNNPIKIGIFQRLSHNIIDVDTCLIQSEAAEKIIAILRQ